jgi:hypothetical protein
MRQRRKAMINEIEKLEEGKSSGWMHRKKKGSYSHKF